MSSKVSTIIDPSLAHEGERKIEWVAAHAHTLNAFAKSHLADGTLRGRRIALAIHLEAKTAYLAWLFHEAGAEVVATGSNPWSTQDDVAAALARRGLTVHAIHGADAATFDDHLLRTLDFGPDLVVDDGAELVTRLHLQRRDLLPAVRAGSEETTSGVLRLRAMEREGALTFPVIASNDARCKHLIDNRYGTGQSALSAILAVTNLLLAGKDRRGRRLRPGWTGPRDVLPGIRRAGIRRRGGSRQRAGSGFQRVHAGLDGRGGVVR